MDIKGRFIVIATAMGYGLAGIGAAYLAAGVLILIVLYLAVFGNSSLAIGIRFMNMDSFKSLFGFSIWIFLSKMFAFLAYRIDTIIIGMFLPPANITYYNIALRYMRLCDTVFSAVIPPSSLSIRIKCIGRESQAESSLSKATRYTVLIMYPVLAFVFFYSKRLSSCG